MTELSPAAQAVLTAYNQRALAAKRTTAIAAALRATALKIEDLYCDSDVEDSAGIVFALRQLMLIADELEAQ